jgi:hypothetical protein
MELIIESYDRRTALRVPGRGRWASSMIGLDRLSTTVLWPTMGDPRKTARPTPSLVDQAATRAPEHEQKGQTQSE